MPPSGFASAQTRPRWSSMIERQMLSPIPIPSALVVKNGSKRWSRISGERPQPRSEIETVTDVAARLGDDADLAPLGAASPPSRPSRCAGGSARPAAGARRPPGARGPPPASRASIRTRRLRASASANPTASSTTAFTRTGVRVGSLLRTKSWTRRMIRPARCACWAVFRSASSSSSRGGAPALEQVQAPGRVARDRGERLVQLVRDGRGHLADGDEARGRGELLLLLPHELARALALGDVEHRAHPAGLAPLGVDERRLVDERVEPLAVAPHEPHLDAGGRRARRARRAQRRLGSARAPRGASTAAAAASPMSSAAV